MICHCGAGMVDVTTLGDICRQYRCVAGCTTREIRVLVGPSVWSIESGYLNRLVSIGPSEESPKPAMSPMTAPRRKITLRDD
jgi:hypothetical protein